jgi:hypothetical protein
MDWQLLQEELMRLADSWVGPPVFDIDRNLEELEARTRAVIDAHAERETRRLTFTVALSLRTDSGEEHDLLITETGSCRLSRSVRDDA